jgi:hypothetical protein
MSLFPAYSNEINKRTSDDIHKKKTDSIEDLRWLKNSSYQPISSYLNSSVNNETWTDSSDEDLVSDLVNKDNNEKIEKSESKKSAKQSRVVKKRVKTSKKKIQLVQYETDVKDIYFEDKSRNKRFLTIETLEFTVRPNYKLWNGKLGINFNKKIKRKHFKRYHAMNLEVHKKSIKNERLKKPINNSESNTESIQEEKIYKSDDEQKKIEEFSKKITDCPKDVNAWLEYVHFQDKVVQSCSFYSEQKNLKQIINQKKLDIIEKGLEVNNDSAELLKLKLHLMSAVLPADQLSNEIEIMIGRDVKNIILWESLIRLIQNSCVLCKVSKVLNSYVKYFSILKQKCKTDPKFYDEQILDLLYQCLIFLRHAGLWEQMWEILKINLCLNLEIDRETLKNINTIDEKVLMNMEELILNSKLPLNQLWLRIELLRERFYWTGVDIKEVDINLIGDEKRLVSADETTDFIYPTISMESNFRLVMFTLLCLKVPLLPSRHCTLNDFKLEKDCWTIDSLESILPMLYSTVWIGAVDKYLSNKTMLTTLLEGELTSGPQFIKFHPAQELFLDFIRLVFNTISQKLPTIQRTSILIWWLRFERLLVFVSKNDPLKEESRNKKVKSIIKNFLKKPENRNNLHFYREYALFEYELGSFDSCVQMLKKIIQSQDTKFLDVEEKAALFSLYRTIFEILLDLNTYKNSNLEIFEELVKTLKNYVSVCFKYNQNMSVEEMLYEEIFKFLTNSVTDESEDTFMLPNIYCDLLICHAYILYSKNNENDSNNILDIFNRCLIHCGKCLRLQERFYETKIAFLQFSQSRIPKHENILIDCIGEALDKFPSNFFFLSVNASIESKLPYWKLQTNNRRYNIWSILANCLAGRARIIYLNSIGFEEASNAMTNKMLSFHKMVSKTEEVQSCPLVWRLYMLLLREHDLCKKKGEEVYYQAVAQCPWSRSVYISAAEIAPQILSQIQDLIQEKELRMHVTPDELDILRG